MEIAWVGGSKEGHRALSAGLKGLHCRVVRIDTLPDLENYMQKHQIQALIIDLDTLPIGKNFFRDLKRMSPELCIMALSSHPFHPDLEEAFSQYLYACLKKPLDMDELLYLLKDMDDRTDASQNDT